MVMDIAKRFIKDRKAIFLVIAYLITIIGYELVNGLNIQSVSLATTLDSKIPLIKYFVIPYYMWYALVLFSFIYIYGKNNEEFYKFAKCIVLTMLSALVIFIFFQTSVSRPIIIGDDVFSNMIRSIYENDRPVNCCPSLHVALALICSIWGCRVSENKILKSTVIIVGYLIILSTLFIKQHVIIDVIVAFVQVLILRIIVDRNSYVEYEEAVKIR